MARSLWARYHEETEGHSIIENESGFIRYSFAPPNAFIHDIYVIPEKRGEQCAFSLANAVKKQAESADCHTLWAEVGLASRTRTEALRLNLRYGFQIHSANNGFIILNMHIGGANG